MRTSRSRGLPPIPPYGFQRRSRPICAADESQCNAVRPFAKAPVGASHGFCATITTRLQPQRATIAQCECHNPGRSSVSQSLYEEGRYADFPVRPCTPEQIGGRGGFLCCAPVFDNPVYDGVRGDGICPGVIGCASAADMLRPAAMPRGGTIIFYGLVRLVTAQVRRARGLDRGSADECPAQ